ncbi:MAG: hypothetical protein JJE39_08110 [Vicinamibacteria bacterium]|nr:hypothetical protein [Vicinamibacteria bacterium]
MSAQTPVDDENAGFVNVWILEDLAFDEGIGIVGLIRGLAAQIEGGETRLSLQGE